MGAVDAARGWSGLWGPRLRLGGEHVVSVPAGLDASREPSRQPGPGVEHLMGRLPRGGCTPSCASGIGWTTEQPDALDEPRFFRRGRVVDPCPKRARPSPRLPPAALAAIDFSDAVPAAAAAHHHGAKSLPARPLPGTFSGRPPAPLELLCQLGHHGYGKCWSLLRVLSSCWPGRLCPTQGASPPPRRRQTALTRRCWPGRRHEAGFSPLLQPRGPRHGEAVEAVLHRAFHRLRERLRRARRPAHRAQCRRRSGPSPSRRIQTLLHPRPCLAAS